MPTMITTITALKREKDIDHLQNIISKFDNKRNLANSLKVILDGLEKRSNSE
jgi:phosphopantothenate synthetase